MVEIHLEYRGDLHTEAVHGPSSTRLETDAPKDNQGRGDSYSPTDLLATALGTCMVTIMAMAARERGIELAGTRVRVEKHMVKDPRRRVGRLDRRHHPRRLHRRALRGQRRLRALRVARRRSRSEASPKLMSYS